MSERVALVTGAARGIGASVVAALAADHVRVIAVDVCSDDPALKYALASKEELDAVAQLAPHLITPVIADVRDELAMHEIVEEILSLYGGLDIAVAAAGAIAGGRPLWETSAADFDLMFDVNVRGVWNLAAAAVPAMLQRPAPRDGRFIALASAAAHQALWHLAAYNAAKHAVVGLVKGLAADLRGTGITAMAVSPGSTDTAMLRATADLYSLDSVDDLAGGQLIGRVLQPEEVAAAVRWLCSPDSVALTGTVVHADGGFTA